MFSPLLKPAVSKWLNLVTSCKPVPLWSPSCQAVKPQSGKHESQHRPWRHDLPSWGFSFPLPRMVYKNKFTSRNLKLKILSGWITPLRLSRDINVLCKRWLALFLVYVLLTNCRLVPMQSVAFKRYIERYDELNSSALEILNRTDCPGIGWKLVTLHYNSKSLQEYWISISITDTHHH